jgi:predicted HicB family RNase H-like nuclease
MAKRASYHLGADVPDSETLRDRKGRVIDDRYVSEAVADALHQARRRGRPSLSESGESPLLRVRISRELDQAVRQAAEKTGASRTDWVRQALTDATRKAG